MIGSGWPDHALAFCPRGQFTSQVAAHRRDQPQTIALFVERAIHVSGCRAPARSTSDDRTLCPRGRFTSQVAAHPARSTSDDRTLCPRGRFTSQVAAHRRDQPRRSHSLSERAIHVSGCRASGAINPDDRTLLRSDQAAMAWRVDERQDLGHQRIVAEPRAGGFQPLREHTFLAEQAPEGDVQLLDLRLARSRDVSAR